MTNKRGYPENNMSDSLKQTPNQEAENEYQTMTRTPVERLIIRLAIPTIISMLVTSIYNTADTYFVSRIGTSASGAVGIVFSLMALYQAIGYMCGHGSGSYISRFLGAREEDNAKTYGATAFWMSFSLGALVSIVCLVFMNPILYLLGSTDTILPYARQYAFWIYLSGPFLTASCTMNNHLRYEGKSFYAMIGLTAGGILNIIGDPILMFGLHLGVTGAGLSTCLSQIVSFLILLYMMHSGRTVVRYNPSLIAGKGTRITVMANIAATGSASFARQILSALSTVFLNQQAKIYDDAAIAAMSIVGRVTVLISAIAIGIGQGMQPVASFNYGAGFYSRVKKSWRFVEIAGTIFLCIMGGLSFIFAGPIIRWFRNDPDVIRVGTTALRWAAVSAILQATSVSSNMLLQSIGRARSALVLASLRSGIFFIPLILILPAFFGITGIEIAQPLADIFSAIVSLPIVLHAIKGFGPDKVKNKATD